MNPQIVKEAFSSSYKDLSGIFWVCVWMFQVFPSQLYQGRAISTSSFFPPIGTTSLCPSAGFQACRKQFKHGLSMSTLDRYLFFPYLINNSVFLCVHDFFFSRIFFFLLPFLSQVFKISSAYLCHSLIKLIYCLELLPMLRLIGVLLYNFQM